MFKERDAESLPGHELGHGHAQPVGGGDLLAGVGVVIELAWDDEHATRSGLAVRHLGGMGAEVGVDHADPQLHLSLGVRTEREQGFPVALADDDGGPE